MKILFRHIALTLTALICLACVACGQEADVQDHTHVYGTTVYFVTDEQKQDWEAPLAALLSNVEDPYQERGENRDVTSSVDPDAPTTPPSHYCGLFDVTADGVPELMLFPYGGGGSAGNALYYVYDIFSGEQIGCLEGGFDKSWCYYYHPDMQAFTAFGQYSWRIGWSGRERYIAVPEYNNEREKYDIRIYLYAYYEIAGEVVDPQPSEEQGIFTGTWIESYPGTIYEIYGHKATLDEYYTEYQRLTEEYVRIPETALCLLSWSDVCGQEEDAAVRGSQMARALLQTEQKFIDYAKQH